MTSTRAARLERQITVAAVVLPFLGFIAAIWLLWGGAVTGLDLAILAVMYAAVGFRARSSTGSPTTASTTPSPMRRAIRTARTRTTPRAGAA